MSFASDIEKFAAKAKVGYNDAVNSSLFDISSAIMKSTPVAVVLGGTARGNWLASLSSYSTSTSDNTKPNFSQVQAVASKAAGSVFYLTNNMPYIGKLEYGGYPNPSNGDKTINGFSKQAPQGMVRVSIENFQQMLSESANNLKS
jgi:hypothetical protein